MPQRGSVSARGALPLASGSWAFASAPTVVHLALLVVVPRHSEIGASFRDGRCNLFVRGSHAVAPVPRTRVTSRTAVDWHELSVVIDPTTPASATSPECASAVRRLLLPC